MHLKKLIKISEFCVAILIQKMGKYAKSCHIVLYYFKKGKNAMEMQKKKKRFVLCLEKVL